MSLTRDLAVGLVVFGALAGAARADDEEKPKTDLIDVVRRTPLGNSLDCGRVRPFGWVEASVSASPLTDSGSRAARVFDGEVDGFRLHQAHLALERTPSEDRCFDVGGKVAVLWGTDARLVHALGLLDDQDGDEEQFDLLEAYASARFAIAHGLTVKAGKFVTSLGFEVIDAPYNLLPSRSFLFGFAIPFTHTGMMATLGASGQVNLTYGLVTGWDVWDDNNDAWTHIAGFAWTSASKKDSVTLNAILGAERAGNDRDLRTVLDATWAHTLCDDSWTTALNADVGSEEGAAAGGGDAHWWGVAGYVTKKFSDRVSGTLRAEWFRDEDGTRLGQAASLGEVTIGLDWKPDECLPNLHLRPEVRWDHSFDGAFFDAGRDEDQLSLTFSVLFTF